MKIAYLRTDMHKQANCTSRDFIFRFALDEMDGNAA